MQESGRRANQYENAVLDLVEAAALAPRVGETFDAVVVDVDDKDDRHGDLTVQEPAIEARVSSEQPLPLGEPVNVTLSVADPATRKVEFTLP
jgi:exoribonuclease R